MTEFRYRISLEVTADTRDAAIAWMEQNLAQMKSSGWKETVVGGGGGGGPSFGISIGPSKTRRYATVGSGANGGTAQFHG